MRALSTVKLPGATRGLKIGLFGGSFNPAHGGHLHVAETALKRLGLDQIWWLVAAGNPLKDRHGVFAERLKSAQQVARGRRMKVTALEPALGVTYTSDFLSKLKRRAPGAHFVWIMGADNLAQFHHWRRWREIAETVPIAVVARPGAGLRARLSRFARQYRAARLPETAARCLASTKPPAWVYLTTPLHTASSTAIRAKATKR